MRKMPWWAASVLAAMGLVGCGDSVAKEPDTQPPLALELRLGSLFDPKDDADVPVTVTLANAGEKPAHVNSRLLVNSPGQPHEIVFTVIGPDLKTRTFESLVNARKESREWKTLSPGERVFNVAHLGKPFDLSQKGFYEVQAVYENQQDAPAGSPMPAWQGRVASAVVRFEKK